MQQHELPEIVVGTGRQRGGLTIFPLFTQAAPEDPARSSRFWSRVPAPTYVLCDEAMAAGALSVRELGEGRVDRVRAENKGRAPVLLLEGQHLLGAKQNRVVNGSALIGAGQRVDVPVSCVEQHRWQVVRDAVFRAAEQAAPLELRRVLKLSVTRAALGRQGHAADQGQIWATIAGQQRARGVRSPTAALHDSFVADAPRIARTTEGLGWSEGATGMAAAVDGRLAQLDLFDRPDTCARAWKRLADALALDVGAEPGARASVGVVYDALEALRGAPWRAVPAVGEGVEQRVEGPGGLVASMLALGARIVHFSAVGAL